MYTVSEMISTFPNFIYASCLAELFELSIGISLECPVTLIQVTVVVCNIICLYTFETYFANNMDPDQGAV